MSDAFNTTFICQSERACASFECLFFQVMLGPTALVQMSGNHLITSTRDVPGDIDVMCDACSVSHWQRALRVNVCVYSADCGTQRVWVLTVKFLCLEDVPIIFSLKN